VAVSELVHASVLSEGSRPIFPDLETRLAATRRIARHFGPFLLWFCLADTHWHGLIEIQPGRAGFVARDFALVLQALGTGPFQAPHLKPVESRAHLVSCFRYILGNREHHGLGGDSLADPGSCAPDLVGARRLAGFDPEAWRPHLPRLQPRELYEKAGLALAPPASDEAVRALGAARLVEAAAAAIGRTALVGNTPDVVAARVAVVKVGSATGYPNTELAWALSVRRQGIPERRHLEAPALEDALRRRITFDAFLAARPARRPLGA
jgi:hypothetical protein